MLMMAAKMPKAMLTARSLFAGRRMGLEEEGVEVGTVREGEGRARLKDEAEVELSVL